MPVKAFVTHGILTVRGAGVPHGSCGRDRFGEKDLGAAGFLPRRAEEVDPLGRHGQAGLSEGGYQETSVPLTLLGPGACHFKEAVGSISSETLVAIRTRTEGGHGLE